METNLLDRMLNAYQTDQTFVTLTLQNKTRVAGKIKAFDSYVIVMEGQKQEILYRHAVSSLAPAVQEVQRRPPVQVRQAPAKTAARPPKNAEHKPRPAHQQPAISVATGETSINSSMKDGLLKWVQEQKAAK
jgi:host factor-I protein